MPSSSEASSVVRSSVSFASLAMRCRVARRSSCEPSSSTSFVTFSVASWAAIASPSTSPILLSRAVSSAISPLLGSIAVRRLPDLSGAKPGLRISSRPLDGRGSSGFRPRRGAARLRGGKACRRRARPAGARELRAARSRGGRRLGGDDRARGRARSAGGRGRARLGRGRRRPARALHRLARRRDRTRAIRSAVRLLREQFADRLGRGRSLCVPGRRVRGAAVPAGHLALDRGVARRRPGGRARGRGSARRRIARPGPRGRRAAARGCPAGRALARPRRPRARWARRVDRALRAAAPRWRSRSSPRPAARSAPPSSRRCGCSPATPRSSSGSSTSTRTPRPGSRSRSPAARTRSCSRRTARCSARAPSTRSTSWNRCSGRRRCVLSEAVAGATSRRGFLARTGRLLLGVAGGGFVLGAIKRAEGGGLPLLRAHLHDRLLPPPDRAAADRRATASRCARPTASRWTISAGRWTSSAGPSTPHGNAAARPRREPAAARAAHAHLRQGRPRVRVPRPDRRRLVPLLQRPHPQARRLLRLHDSTGSTATTP